ncbi:MAG: hypothetical protein JNG88_05400 [Phycisphaerales bacterium]|nr:hypothetical protein [Phycisphaerales bacterium]
MNCMRTWLILTVLMSGGAAALADGVIVIRLSYKVILDPVDGSLPQGFTDSDIDQAIDEMNDFLETFGRGYRFVRVDPIQRVGNVGGFDRPNPSHYFGINMLEDHAQRANMQADALQFPQPYQWNQNAVNIYINEGNTGGTCARPSEQLIVIGGSSSGAGWLHLHEIGHFFDLCHTQGCSCGCCEADQTGECHTGPGSDGIADTLPDLACWGRDEIAQNSFSNDYLDLPSTQREQVDDVFLNIMSYHRSGCGQGAAVARLTEKQLDRWTDTANGPRVATRDGRTYFVQAGAGGSQNGSSTSPFDLVAEGRNAANGGGDIVMIRGGVYPENLIFNSPMTLRTPRGSVARIGQ